MNLNFFLLLLSGLTVGIPAARGQTASPNVISSVGSTWTDAGGGYTVAWTLGEAVIWTGGNAPQQIAQGFHAPLSYIVPVAEIMDKPAFQVFPNPVTDVLTLDFGESSSTNGWKLILWNLLGQSLQEIEIPASINQYALYCSNLAPGVYLLQLKENGSKSVQTIRFIKN